MFDLLDIGASGLMAQRTRMDTIAANMANANTTVDPNGDPAPYRRRFVVFAPGQPGNPGKPGVHVRSVSIDPSPFRKVFEPGHPHADAEGYVQQPNIDTSIEMVNALEASRAYEANVTMMETGKAMINASLRLIA
jgi:flagellar basal-body rod protein FlgC